MRRDDGPGPVGHVGALLRKAAVLVAGTVLLLAGLAMLLLPGPGWVTIFAGLSLLAREFPWAARLLARLRGVATRLWRRLRGHPVRDGDAASA